MSLRNSTRDSERASWSDLAARVRKGDRLAFAGLFEALYAEAVSYSSSLGSGPTGAEDLVQDAFVRLWMNRSSIDPDRSIRALLFVTVRHLTLNSSRDAANRRRLLQKATPSGGSGPDAPAVRDVESSVDAALLGARINRWIDDLPDREREAFVLSRFSPLSHREIAEVMSISEHTVTKHITSALRNLRDRLKKLHPELV